MRAIIGDRFGVRVIVGGHDYGNGEAKVIGIDKTGEIVTLIEHARPRSRHDTAPFRIVQVSASILDRIKTTGEADPVHGLFPLSAALPHARVKRGRATVPPSAS